MRVVLQCVRRAAVRVKEETGGETVTGQIGRGFLLFLGISDEDTEQTADKMMDKICKLRVFPDENGKTNLSVKDIGGEILVVSQFTLYADCRKGNRPSFTDAGSPEHAEVLYEYFKEGIRARLGKAASGRFGAHMQVELVNDGPFTLFLDSKDLNLL